MPLDVPADSAFFAQTHFYREATVRVGHRCWVGPGTIFHVAAGVTLGDDVLISWDCFVMDTDMHTLDWLGRARDAGLALRGADMSEKDWPAIRCLPITIARRVWIGARCMILPGSRIGEGAVVGAGSVVRGYAPPYTLVAGHPARVLKRLPVPEDADLEPE